MCVCVVLCSSEDAGKEVDPENDNKVSLAAEIIPSRLFRFDINNRNDKSVCFASERRGFPTQTPMRLSVDIKALCVSVQLIIGPHRPCRNQSVIHVHLLNIQLL